MNATEMLYAEQAAATDPRLDRSKPIAPFAIRDLSVLAYANGFTLWHYKAATIGDLLSSNYFGDCRHMSAGDQIHVSAPDGGALLHVTSSAPGETAVRKMAASV